MSIYKKLKLLNLFVAVLFCGILLTLSTSLSIYFDEAASDYAKMNIAVILSQIIVYGIPILIYKSLDEYLTKKYVSVDPSSNNISSSSKIYSLIGLKSVFITLIVSAATILLMYTFRNFLFNLLYGVFGITPQGLLEEHDHIEAATMTIQQFIISMISVVIVSSVLEETFFRGIIVRSFDHLPTWITIVFSTFCFTIAHHSLMQMVLVIPLSVVCAYVILKTKNIIHPILIHASANLVAIFNLHIDEMFFSMKYPIKYNEPRVALTNSFFCFAILVVLIIIIVSLVKSLYGSKATQEQAENVDVIAPLKKSSVKEWAFYGVICIVFCLILLRINTMH